MGVVVNVSEPGLDLMLYGDRSQFIGNYLQQQIQQLGPVMNSFGERLMGAVQTSYDFVTDQLTQMGLKHELQSQGLGVVDNYFVELPDWEAMQQANLTMQRWVMAQPDVRDLYQSQDIDGYSDEYVDLDEGGIGESHYDYRRVMDGVITDGEEVDEWVIKHYFEDLLPGDRELDHYEKELILNTWEAAKYMLETCDFDFTAKTEEPSKINR